MSAHLNVTNIKTKTKLFLESRLSKIHEKITINTLHVYHLFGKDFVDENRSSEEIRTVEKRRNTQWPNFFWV